MEVLPHLRSAHDNVRKHVSVPNWLTIASTSCKICSQYAGVPLTELINENALFLATNLSIVPLKLLLTVPAASTTGLIIWIGKFIDECKWSNSYTDLGKIYIISSDAKYWLKFNNIWLKHQAGPIGLCPGAL